MSQWCSAQGSFPLLCLTEGILLKLVVFLALNLLLMLQLVFEDLLALAVQSASSNQKIKRIF